MLDFLGIGAQKSGTTWLYEMMRLHPQIDFPAGKEVHFWDRPYAKTDKAQYFDQFRASHRCSGEITPAYAMLDAGTIAEIGNVLPLLRLIFIIRNPIDRAWSSALMALQRAEMTLDEASDQWFIDHFYSAGSIARGDYETTIRNWRSCFGEERLLILRYEALSDHPRGLLEAVAEHLRVSPKPFRSLPEETITQHIFSGIGAPIRESLRPVLEKLYRHRIDSLSAYLNESLPW
jgi:hypothetical protein